MNKLQDIKRRLTPERLAEFTVLFWGGDCSEWERAFRDSPEIYAQHRNEVAEALLETGFDAWTQLELLRKHVNKISLADEFRTWSSPSTLQKIGNHVRFWIANLKEAIKWQS